MGACINVIRHLCSAHCHERYLHSGHFWRFLLTRGYTQKNPTLKIILPKTNKPLPAFFKQTEMEIALNETFLPENFEALRNHLILEMFYLTGIRLSELISIKDNDLDLAEGNLRVVGKRNKTTHYTGQQGFLLKN